MNTSTKLQVVDLDKNPPADVEVRESDISFSREPMHIDIPLEKIRACNTPGDAFKLACWASGLDDKEIYSEVGIDAGYFTNIKKNAATLKADKEALFCKVVGNRIYPEWRAAQLGCSMVSVDRYEDLLAIEAAAKKLKIENELLLSVLGQRVRSA